MATTTNSGIGFRVWTFSVTTTDTPIVLNQKVDSILIQCRTSVDIYLRSSAGASEYFTIRAGTALTLDISNHSLTPFSLQSSNGTVTVEIIGTYE